MIVIKLDSYPDRWECRDIKILYIQDPFYRVKQTAAFATSTLSPHKEEIQWWDLICPLTADIFPPPLSSKPWSSLKKD